MPGEVVEGKVIGMEKTRVYVTSPLTAQVSFTEKNSSPQEIHQENRHRRYVSAKVVDYGNKEGYIELSLKKQDKLRSGRS